MLFTRIIRAAIAVFLIALAVVIGLFLIRSQVKHRVPVKAEKLTQQKIEKKERLKYTRTKGKEPTHSVTTDKQYLGEDDQYHLEGNVEIVFFKKKEGKDVFLYGQEVVYDRDMNHFVATGKAKANFKDLIIESTVLHYEDKEELFWTESGVTFSSQRLKGSARKMTYSMKKEEIELHESAKLSLMPKFETSLPVIVWGNDLVYSRKKKNGTMKGGVSLFRGKSHASAKDLYFELDPDEELIRTLFLKGKAKAILIDEEKRENSSRNQPSFLARSEKREIEAEEIEIKSFPGLQTIQALEGKQSCSFKFFSESGSNTHILAESVKFEFDLEGGLKEFHASTNARMIDEGEDPAERRLIAGETLTIKDNTDVLRVKGKGQFETRITSSDSDVFTDEVTLNLDSGNFEAKGGVKVVLKSKKGEENSIGIFSREYPVSIRAKEMRYFDEKKRFLFKGNVKAWQEKKTLFADDIELYEETGEIFCTDNVISIFPHKPKEEKKEERIEISADRMTFKPEENLVLYEKKCTLKIKELILNAQSISVYLKDNMEDMKETVARGKVIIVQDVGEARGKEARYDPDKETIILLGNPVLEDKERGITKGDKLTFYIADGRIFVENKGKERSVTVIKRER